MIAAKERAAIILQVRSGQLTVTQAAQQLGISRQRYYKLEQAALQAMVQTLEPKPPGRRPDPQPSPEQTKLEQRVIQLEKELHEYQQREKIRAEIEQITESVYAAGSAKKNA